MTTTSCQVIRGLGAVILAGGASRRLGRDKATLVFEGRSFLQTIAHAVEAVCDPVVVAVRAEQQLPTGFTAVTDQRESQGPLEGIRVGLKALAGSCDRAFVTGCDSPLLQSEVIRWLDSRIGDHQAIVPFDETHRYGLTAIYRTSVHTKIEQMLDQQQRRVVDLVAALDARLEPVQSLRTVDAELKSLFNINTPGQYAMLQEKD